MKINQEHSLDIEIPLQLVQSLSFDWGINRHATMEITGIIKGNCPDSVWSRNYCGTEVKLYQNQMENGDAILFRGIIQKADLKRHDRIGEVRIQACSASIKLDNCNEKCCEGFQNPEQSYREIAKQVMKESGNVICTIGQEAINRPIICYQETEWEFLKRIASHQGGYLVSDIKTGKPSLWFGMREGKKISEEIQESTLEIKIEKSYDNEESARKSYIWESTNSYSIGDWAQINEKQGVIYEVQCRLERGVLKFQYGLSASPDLKTNIFFNKNFVGMSLWGTVEETKGETVRVTFDMDNKEGEWFYPWRPETGNSLYAVPEVGAKVAVYFMDHADGSGIAVRCSGQPPEDTKPKNKLMITPVEAEIKLFADCLGVRKEKEWMEMRDSSYVDFSGNQFEIEASGKIKFQARQLTLNAISEIRAITE